jgi:protein TonB
VFARLRARFGRRAAGLGLALLAEGLLVLALLTLSPTMTRTKEERTTVFAFAPERPAPATPDEAAPAPEREATDAPPTERLPEAPAEAAPSAPAPPVAAPAPPPMTPPATLPAPIILLSREEMATADRALKPSTPALAAAPRRAAAGPRDTGGSFGADTPRVSGTGPNGEPLYAAAWYREPYPEELRGYLSTSRGPGWGLIACRTVKDYRVEDCIAVGEYPEGSNIARSVLAAAWQFRVRPPRLGGQSKVGEWVRIRIDYDLKRE